MLTQKTLARTAEEKKTNEENQKQTAIELTKEGLLPEPDEESAGSSKQTKEEDSKKMVAGKVEGKPGSKSLDKRGDKAKG